MSIINEGTVSTIQGGDSVIGIDTLFLTRGVSSGDLFQLSGGAYPYIISNVLSETSLVLQENYKTASVDNSEYEISTDFLAFGVPKVYPEMQDSFPIFNYIHQKLIAKIKEAGAASIEYQITPKPYLGQPVQGQEFGIFTWDLDVQIDKIRISTDISPPDTDLILDIAINNIYQGLNLTLPAFLSLVSSSDLTYQISYGDTIKFKWVTVGVSPGSDYYIDIIWHATTALTVRYDFIRQYIGQLQVDKIIGNGYSPPVKSIFYAISYELTNPAEGTDIILELLKNGTSLGTPVTVTIPVLSSSSKITHAQTEFETTDTYSWKIIQIGSTFPGEDLILTAHSFRVE